MKKNQDLTWSQVAMAANAAMLTRATMVEGALKWESSPLGNASELSTICRAAKS